MVKMWCNRVLASPTYRHRRRLKRELQGFGQCALDPGACHVALTPFLRFLLAADLLPR